MPIWLVSFRATSPVPSHMSAGCKRDSSRKSAILAKHVPPVSHCFVADLDPTLMKEVLQVAKRQRETNVEHHCQADDVWTRLEVAERWVLGDLPPGSFLAVM